MLQLCIDIDDSSCIDHKIRGVHNAALFEHGAMTLFISKLIIRRTCYYLGLYLIDGLFVNGRS